VTLQHAGLLMPLEREIISSRFHISMKSKKSFQESNSRYNFNYIEFIKNNFKHFLFQIKNLLYNIKYI